MKAVKIILSVLVALIVVVAIVVFIGLKNLNNLVELAIESVGPQVTKTDVQVDRVNIELTEGRGSIYGLTVANPEGFSGEHIFVLDQVSLQIQPSSLTENVVVIREILVDGARVNGEHQGVAEINLREMLNNIQSGEPEPPKDTTASPDVRFMVEKLSVTGTTINLSSPEFGERELTMKDIQLSDLGDREEGLTPEELARAILTPILDQARSRVEQEVKDRVGDEIEQKLKENLSEEDQQKIDKVRSLLGN